MKHIRTIALSLLLLLPSTAALAAFPVTITDDLGRDVTVPQAPTRIVSMLPSHTETVCALAACDLLVGVDDWSNHPADIDGLPRLGGLWNPNLEGIVALEPDLVLVSDNAELAAALENAGLTVYAGSPETLEETYAFFVTLGSLLGRSAEGEALAERVRGEVDAVTALTAGAERPSVYYEIDATPYSVGPGGFIGTLLALAGGDNIVAEGMGDFPQLDPEYVVAADPEIVILANAPYGETVDTLAERPGWGGLQALESGRVLELTSEQSDILSRPGPRLGEAVRLLASVFHPGLID